MITSHGEVANGVMCWMSLFGPPRILQCDNGKEFKGALLILVKEYGIQIVHGHPRHPQSQSLVEQANGVLKLKQGD